jgi:RNA polymerase sigma-70 factor (ECF subfamily)
MVFTCNEWLAGAELNERTASTFRPPASPALARTLGGTDPDQLVNAANQPEPSAEQLAARCQGGCPDSFEQLVLRYEAQVFNFLHQFARHRQDAEDLTQVTFLKAYRNLSRYKPSLAFAPWLFSIARRTAASHFRSRENFEELPVDGEIVEENPANLLASKDEQNALWRLARTLKPKQWEVLWLRYGEGFSIAETARVMRTNQIHVKVLLHRARGNLSKRLTAHGAGLANSIRRPEPGPQAVRTSEKMKGVL